MLSGSLCPVDSWYVLGADLGGSTVRVVLADPVGASLADAAAPTPRDDGASVLARITSLSRSVAATAAVDWPRVAGLVVGVPGVVPVDGAGLRLAPNLPSLADVDMARVLREELGVPVALENDVNLATLAEQHQGHGAGVPDFVFIGVGTGIGMGIVASGQLQTGATGAAGEIASLPLSADPFEHADHEGGSLEEHAGGAGLARRYATLAGLPERDVPAVEVYRRAVDGDALARRVLDEQARALALGIVSVHSVLDPALVVLGGGIGSRPDLAPRVRAEVARLSLRDIRIETSRLGERAGLLGAARLALQQAKALAARGEDGHG